MFFFFFSSRIRHTICALVDWSSDVCSSDLIGKALEIVPKQFKALVVYNEGTHFSAGVNLGLAMFAANVGAWPIIDDIVAEGQKIYLALKRAPFPVVAAPSGLALGGDRKSTRLNSSH